MNKHIEESIWLNFFKNKAISLDAENITLLHSIFKPRRVQKDNMFLEEGEKSIEIGLITKGVFRSYYIDQAGNDITKYFYAEGGILFSYAAYLSGNDSRYCIQALEDSEILAANIYEFEKIVEGNYALLLFYKKMIDNFLVMKEEHAMSFKLLSSKERYEQFQSAYPRLEERIKQCYLASYLGITPVSLSRIRKKLCINK